MKKISLFAMLLVTGYGVSAQYYYKDILTSKQAQAGWKSYHDNKVSSIELQSLEETGEPTPGFSCTQQLSKDFRTLVTNTKSTEAVPTTLTSTYGAQGQLLKTEDTSDSYQSTSTYEYDAAGRLLAISNRSVQTDNHISSTEVHSWTYNTAGIPVEMIKVKDGADTTFVHFTADEKGNVVEEHPEHRGQKMQVIYYYYSPTGQLTDIVRYNEKAQRLLPDYIFEYNEQGLTSSMLFVPAGSNDYEQWTYLYDGHGLRTNDTARNKHKQTIGKIDYHYRFQ